MISLCFSTTTAFPILLSSDPAYICGVYLPYNIDHGWKFRYSVACLAPTVKFCSFLKAPGYSQFLELDRRIRTFPLPHHLQSPLDESPEGWADDPSLAMQQYGVVCERESSEYFGDILQLGDLADRSSRFIISSPGLLHESNSTSLKKPTWP